MKTPTKPQLIGNIPNSAALAHYVATHPTLFKKGVFVVVQYPTDRRIFTTSLPEFLRAPASRQSESTHPRILEWNGQIHLLPQLLQYDIIVSDQKTIESTLLPAPSILERQTLRFAQNETLDLRELREKLVDMGFERDSTATRQGTFAIRGDILDIHTDRPYRVSFFGDTIEKVETLAPQDFTPEQTLDTPVLVAPINSRGRSSLYDYIPEYKQILIYDTELPETVSANRAPESMIHAEVLALPNAEASADAEIDTNPPYSIPKSYHLRRDELLSDIRAAKKVIIFTKDAGAMHGFLKEDADLASHIQIVEVDTLGRGFVVNGSGRNLRSHSDERRPIDTEARENADATAMYSSKKNLQTNLLCLTDSDIGLTEKREKKASKKLQRAMMQQLQPGDHVVHTHHGIARFAKMETMNVNNLDREYFVLEFAGRDKIYLPVELADRLDKYIGEDNPPLQKLSGATWNTTLAKVQEDAAKVAQELLDIYARRTTASAHHILPQPDEVRLDNACPYDLTPDQIDALEDIFADMQKDQPMDRLLCGDVGFGKTEVALRAAYRAILSGYQVAVLAPTTVLTQQHFDTFKSRLEPLGVTVGELSRYQTRAQQKEVIEGLKNGKVDVVVGTHRLFSSDVSFKNLALIVIDEEQRFGVKAKETLTALRAQAHVLTMTATPIPRTLHLSLSGIRAISTILTPPKLRKPVELTIAPLATETIVQAVAREKARGGQVYYVYNRVQSIERRRMELEALLAQNGFEGIRIGVAHGQLAPKQLADVMHKFDVGEIDLLLASSIIENGLDIANANTIVVENAAMFGLAELYQLKGRVGRSKQQGFAYFLYKEQVLDGDVKQRFLALQAASGLGDGFELAMRDMEIRGIGNMLGKQQHGHATKIGMHLYVRLLNAAVQQLQGSTPEVLRDVKIDLPLEARIPEDAMPNDEERILLYQRLANITELSDLEDARRELMDHNSLWDGDKLRPEVDGFLNLIDIKIRASRSNLVSINVDYPNELNKLASPRITIASDKPLPDLPAPWERVYEKSHMAFKARATKDQLGKTDEQWLDALREVIALCS